MRIYTRSGIEIDIIIDEKGEIHVNSNVPDRNYYSDAAMLKGIYEDMREILDVVKKEFPELRGEISQGQIYNGMIAEKRSNKANNTEHRTGTKRNKNKTGSSTKVSKIANTKIYDIDNQYNHYDYFSSIAIEIFNDALAKGASDAGALYVVAQAAEESGYGVKSVKDYNLFNIKGIGSRKAADKGTFKDYSKIGGYGAAIADYFNLISNPLHGYTGMDLIKKDQFTADDIDKAFNTGAYFPDEKTRNKTGIGSYAGIADSPNYGKTQYATFKTDKRLFTEALDYEIGLITEEKEQLVQLIRIKEGANSLYIINDDDSVATDINKYTELCKKISQLLEVRARIAKIDTKEE